MGILVSKVLYKGGDTNYYFKCLGCKNTHPYHVPPWQFNNNADKPSFAPSLLVYPSEIQKRCHLYVTDGKIIYLSDCEHGLANKTIDMVEFKTASVWDEF